MNTRNTILAISGAVGGALGWFVGSVIADYIDEKELRDQQPIQIEQEETEDDDEEESSEAETTMSKTQKPKREKTNYVTYFKSIDRPDLAALAEKYKDGGVVNSSMDSELIHVDELENMVPPALTANKEITIISSDEFNDNQDEYEVVELSYYTDDIIVGEDDNVIPDPEDIIGNDALVSFGMLSGDSDIVYVRNQKNKALYEIVRMTVKYAIDSSAEDLIPRKGKKIGLDYDEVTYDENYTEDAS